MTSIIGAVVLIAATVLPVAADGPTYSDWGAPSAVAEANTAAHDGCPIESPNGKQLYVASTRAGGFGKNDIWVAERPNTKELFGPMQNLGAAINSADHEFCPTPLGGGWLLFVSDRTACGATPGMTPPVGDVSTVVTPCQHEQLPSGSQNTCASIWVWPSMKPGVTTWPVASICSLPRSRSRPIAAIRLPVSPTSAR